MPAAILSLEIVLGAAVVLLLAFLAVTYTRRRVILRGASLMVLAGWRPDHDHRWRLGQLRLGRTHLEWFALVGVSTRPQHSWDRSRLELEAPLVPRTSDRIDLIPDGAPVPCGYGDEQFQLALSPDAYTALRSWAEAAPPGSAANVA